MPHSGASVLRFPGRLALLAGLVVAVPLWAASVAPVAYRLQLDVVTEGMDGDKCWFHPRAGAIPGPTPTVVLTMQKWNVKRSDVFYAVASGETRDLGRTWTPFVEHHDTLGRHRLDAAREEGICDFTPKWHAATGRLLGTGQTVFYENDKLVAVRPRHTVWSVYDPVRKVWAPWAKLEMPALAKFANAGAGSTQRVDLENGDLLLPIYAKEIEAKACFATVVRCRFDGTTLRYVEHGTELMFPVDRGFVEPSLSRYRGRYYLTLRNDRAAYVARSEDGLNFGTVQAWTFDDGAELGSYNTQAHWVTHADGLFLAYTRRGANNENMARARHRAPLLLAQVDPERLVVLRATEREIVPNKGAQLGNFAVVDVNERETWVTTSEGMAPGNPAEFGANGRVYAARIQWEKPNRDWNRR
ncbi:MAG: exo-alpha-sialidase [Verrucomicrobia bacterium]|nr:exo-alpha-sialidase [Verrucomicrobiota bacterium]